MTIPLPPALRKIQQSWAWQVLALPVLIGFGGFLLAQGCLAHGIFAVDTQCLKDATSATVVSFLTVLISGHSPNSATFKADGTVNHQVAEVVAVTKVDDAVKEAVQVKADAS